MSVILGTGPFARPRREALNFDLDAVTPPHLLYLHEVPQRVRGELAGEPFVDTTRAELLHETGLLPVWYLPLPGGHPPPTGWTSASTTHPRRDLRHACGGGAPATGRADGGVTSRRDREQREDSPGGKPER